jgi:hypothetical protein
MLTEGEMSYQIERDKDGLPTRMHWMGPPRTCARCKFWREGDSAKYDGWCEPLNRGTARAFFCGFWEEAD